MELAGQRSTGVPLRRIVVSKSTRVLADYVTTRRFFIHVLVGLALISCAKSLNDRRQRALPGRQDDVRSL
jgi:hypothetical protein